MTETKDDHGFPQLTSEHGNHYGIPSGQPDVDVKRVNLSLFGLASNHLDRALKLDDDDAMKHWLTECGGLDCQVLGHLTAAAYVRDKGGPRCKKAIAKLSKS